MDRILSFVAATFAAILLVVLPAAYFVVTLGTEVTEVRTELQNQSRWLSASVEADPAMWAPGHPKLMQFMHTQPWDGDTETRVLLDLKGTVLAESQVDLEAPVYTNQIPVYLGGKRAGTLVFTRSERDVWEKTAIVLLLSAFLAAGLYAVIRFVPARPLRRAIAMLVQEQKHSLELQSALKAVAASEAQYREHADELGRQKATLSALMDAVPALISYKDVNGAYLGCNAAYAQALNVTKEALVGCTDEVLWDKERAALTRSRDLEMLRTLEARDFEEWVTFHDGSKQLLHITKAPFRDAEGKLIGLIGVGRDVTQQRQAEADIRLAKELAEDATRMKSDFLANMSHEIRTPMNAVLGLSHLLKRTALDDRQRDYVQKVESSGQHLMRIINDILDFSKVEAGKLEIERREFALDDVLATLSNMVGEKCEAKGLELVLDIAGNVPRQLEGDSLRLGQVLVNLAGNAVKFTERGEVVIAVQAEEVSYSEVTLVFRVTDTGIGMSEETISRLFGSFQQGDASTTRKYGGTGLGLAISKNLVGLMGGTIGVDSTEGEGTTFWCRLPFGVVVTAPAAPRHADLHGRRALVVDDNDVARTVIVGMLQAMGLDVASASSGKSALAAIASAAADGFPFDVIYVDWQMPGMDGVETARRVRRLQLSQSPMMVMVTSFNRDDVLRQSHDVGMVDVLVKPISARDLHLATMRALQSESAAAAAPQDMQVSSAMAALTELRGARVLLVEDNDINQIVAAEMLADAGLIVDVADDGLQALHRVQNEPFDIVLMDMQMPVMDGLEATSEIRKIHALRGLPIVAMTANAMDHDRRKCLDAGMNDFVSKPIDPAELWRVLLRWTAVRAPVSG